MPIITRFAPSPTGLLHLGGARTALFNFIFAKSKNGKFKIRFEDTDKSRNQKEVIDRIILDLKWLNIESDEKIIYQSDNIKNHIEFANSLVNNGLAYKCFNDENLMKNNENKKNKIKSEWRDSKKKPPKNSKYCIRIKSPINGSTYINDTIQGKVQIENIELDDFVILRSDMTPTFLLSSVFDDYEMKVTDIIRGDDHLTNSLRQKVLFNFLDYSPNFSHISLIHNEQNQKLSKRDMALSVNDYRGKGILAKSLINYLLRMGWSHGNQEFFTLNEAIKLFQIKNIGKSPTRLDEKKLLFLNNFYIKSESNDSLYDEIQRLSSDQESNSLKKLKSKAILCINLFKARCETIKDLKNKINFLINSKIQLDSMDQEILNKSNNIKDEIISELSKINDWNEINLQETVKNIVNRLQLNFKQVAQPLRLSVCGQVNGPSVSSILFILGKNEVLERINKVWKI